MTNVTHMYCVYHLWSCNLILTELKITWVGVRSPRKEVRRMQRLEICLTELTLTTELLSELQALWIDRGHTLRKGVAAARCPEEQHCAPCWTPSCAALLQQHRLL